MHQEEEREHKALTSLSMDCSVEEEQQPHRLGGAVVKRKRTERRRHHLPAATSSTSSSESTTTEEEDMAHCLILLAQGGAGAHATVDQPSPPPPQPKPQVLPAAALAAKSDRYTSRKYTEAAVTANGSKAGFYVYECKTCSKCFPTFQALGGHRASHKKPRHAAAAEENTNTGTSPIAIMPSLSLHTPSPAEAVIPVATALTLNAGGSSNKLRVHECSICGAEFASGQALGGHMRRHRPLHAPDQGAVTAVTAQVKKERSLHLELDLNLPAPSDEESTSPLQAPEVGPGFVQFDNGKKGLMLTASALVDCHY